MQHQRARTKSVAIVILGFILFCSSSQAQDPQDWKWNDPRDKLPTGVVHETIESASMKRTVGFNIYLPPQYESESKRRFPVVYFLHGSGGTESSDVGLAYRVHAEVQAGTIPPVIYVFPNGGARSGYRDWDDQNVRSETMIIRELIPHVDKKYRTKKAAASRGICGFSMGGNGALRLSVKYPDLFGTAASLGAGLPSNSKFQGGDNIFAHTAKLTEKQRSALHLYLVVGDEDFLYKNHPAVIAAFKASGVRTTFVVHSQVGHNLGEYSRLSANAMIRHLSRNLDSKKK